jgi:hypothetical protein
MSSIDYQERIPNNVDLSTDRRLRNALRRLIVTQGDTEPASVEQQRLLGRTCPSACTTCATCSR